MKKVKNVLFIDDDEITCYINRTFLEDIKLAENIHCLGNEQQALEFLKEQCGNKSAGEDFCPELVFLDLNMPNVSGFEFLDLLQNYPGIDMDKLYIVLLTSSWHTRDIQKAGMYKVQDYVNKPLTHTKLKDIIHNFHLKFGSSSSENLS